MSEDGRFTPEGAAEWKAPTTEATENSDKPSVELRLSREYLAAQAAKVDKSAETESTPSVELRLAKPRTEVSNVELRLSNTGPVTENTPDKILTDPLAQLLEAESNQDALMNFLSSNKYTQRDTGKIWVFAGWGHGVGGRTTILLTSGDGSQKFNQSIPRLVEALKSPGSPWSIG